MVYLQQHVRGDGGDVNRDDDDDDDDDNDRGDGDDPYVDLQSHLPIDPELPWTDLDLHDDVDGGGDKILYVPIL